MSTINRRIFLGTSAAAVAATSVHAARQNRVVLGIIGPGGMGSNHLRHLCKRPDVEIAYVCDVDENRLATAAKTVESETKKAPKTVKDMRKIFEDKDVQAVFIATPDHWHTPASLLALDAGKHVYVEKPCSHNIREGRLLADAVKRTGKCLQVGTQTRSSPVPTEAMDKLKDGAIGEILVAKAWNSQRRGLIGRVKPSEPPPHLDFDTWLGPAPKVDYRSNLLPGRWRWFRAFGAGDIGNDGVHDIDVALWGLGVETHPSTVACLGGKYVFDDDQEWPDTQYAVFEYDLVNRRKQLIFEQRIWSPYVQEDYENGAAFYGTKGMMIVGHTVGWRLYGEKNKLVAEKKGSVDLPAHHSNFLACVRGEQKKLNADVLAGHLSASICHLANIAMTVGRVLHFNPKTEEFKNDADANALVQRKYREHWGTPQKV